MLTINHISSQSTCRTEYRVPDYSLHNGRGGPVVGAGVGMVNGNTLNKHVSGAGGHVHVEHPHHHPQHPLPALWT